MSILFPKNDTCRTSKVGDLILLVFLCLKDKRKVNNKFSLGNIHSFALKNDFRPMMKATRLSQLKMQKLELRRISFITILGQ